MLLRLNQMCNYEVNTSSHSLTPNHLEMLLNYFLLFRKFTKKERLITETFFEYLWGRTQSRVLYHFSEYVFTHFYWSVQLFLRIPDSHKKEKGKGENMVDRNRAALELQPEDFEMVRSSWITTQTKRDRVCFCYRVKLSLEWLKVRWQDPLKNSAAFLLLHLSASADSAHSVGASTGILRELWADGF